MTVKVGISLPDQTHARAVEYASSTGTTLSGLVDAALRAELTRRGLAAWKSGHRRVRRPRHRVTS